MKNFLWFRVTSIDDDVFYTFFHLLCIFCAVLFTCKIIDFLSFQSFIIFFCFFSVFYKNSKIIIKREKKLKQLLGLPSNQQQQAHHPHKHSHIIRICSMYHRLHFSKLLNRLLLFIFKMHCFLIAAGSCFLKILIYYHHL